MKTIEIKGKKYGLTVNLGTMTMAEVLNRGVDASQAWRLTMGFMLACFYGADRDCGLTMDDLVEHCLTLKKFNELAAAVAEESRVWEGQNAQDDMAGVEDADEGASKDGDADTEADALLGN